MRILFVDTTMDGSIAGGAHTFLVKLMKGLVDRNNDVHCIVKGTPKAVSAADILMSGAHLHEDIWNGTQLVDDGSPIVASWINRLRPDVFVVSVSPDIGWTVLPYIDPQIATLTIGHNDEETFYEPVKHYSTFLTRTIGVSEEICRTYVRECGMPEQKVEWIPYGVEVLQTEPQLNERGSLRLLYVGRLDEKQKRISDVVSIVKELDVRDIDCTLDIVGDGDEMPKVRAHLTGEVSEQRVKLHGWLSSEKVIAIMRSSEVFILASAFEGFCISLIEAMANGCVPVVTDIRSGNKQLVDDGANGFVVPIGDVKSFVDRIRLLAEDRERLGRMRVAAWKTGREYSVERMVDNYEKCFERAIADAQSNPRTPDPAFPLMESCRSKYPLWLRRIKAKMINR